MAADLPTLATMRDVTARRLSTLHTNLYRLTGGRIGRRLVANDMLLLTTRGRVTGNPHTVPLLYLTAPDHWVVIASWGGRPDHPEWYKNLVADPRARIQILGESIDVRASTATDSEKSALWPMIVAAYDGYSTYQSRTSRDIPVVLLHRIS